jgi:hypothetical protein
MFSSIRLFFFLLISVTRFLILAEFLATDPEVPGSIPGPTTFSEKKGVWNGLHSAS